MNNVLAVIAAAGEGKRFGGNTPKQYIKLNGKTVIESSVKPFIDSEIITTIIITSCFLHRSFGKAAVSTFLRCSRRDELRNPFVGL